MLPHLGALSVHTLRVGDTKRFNVLRLKYKAAFDAYHAIVERNAELRKKGTSPSEQERIDEDRSSADLVAARAALLNAMRP